MKRGVLEILCHFFNIVNKRSDTCLNTACNYARDRGKDSLDIFRFQIAFGVGVAVKLTDFAVLVLVVIATSGDLLPTVAGA